LPSWCGSCGLKRFGGLDGGSQRMFHSIDALPTEFAASEF